MKKKILGAIALAGALLGFMSCGTASELAKKYADLPGTPDDSVIFYGKIENCGAYGFSQMNEEYPADFLYINNDIFVSKPVAPGSSFALACVQRSYSSGRYIYIYDDYMPLQTELAPIVVNVPKTPGIHFFGRYELKDMHEGEKPEPNMKKYGEKECLSFALDVYKGTAWESVIQNRIDELKGGK